LKELILHDKYEGLDPQIAEALNTGKVVEGKFWDEFISKQTEGKLRDFIVGADYPFISDCGAFINFEPIYKEPKTPDKNTPIDTRCYVWNGIIRPKNPDTLFFAGVINNVMYFFDAGNTSSQTQEVSWHEHAEIIEEE
jgi:hypothetical protein